jgi:hypothetical protein
VELTTMKRTTMVLLIACFCVASAGADPIDRDVVKGLEECFGLTRTADAICEKLSNDTAARLDCLQGARNAQQECLNRVRVGMEREQQLPERSPVAAEKTVPGRTPETTGESRAVGGPSRASEISLEGPPAASDARRATDTAPRREAHVTAPEKPEPLAEQPRDWIVSEMASPIDYSPIMTAELPALSSTSPEAPSALVLRCRNGRTELAVRTRGTWRPSRTGDVEVTMTTDGSVAAHFGWQLAADGKSASSREDAAGVVQGFSARKMSIAISDKAGNSGAAEFDLSGINTVRPKLAATCQRARSEAQSRH